MRTLKNKAGFTLVELIVVIAILAILAGVAIPAYSGYITKAKDATVVTELDAILTAAQAANAKEGALTTIALNKEGTKITVTAATKLSDTFVADFNTYYGGAIDGTATATEVTITLTKSLALTGTSYANGATWRSTTNKWA